MKAILSLLITVISVSAFAATSPKGVICTDDALPDGDKQDYVLELKSDGTYNVNYLLQQGDMRDGVETEASEVLLAAGLECTFGIQDKQLSSCKKEINGKVVSHFSVKLVTEKSVDIIVSGKEYTYSNYQVDMFSEELKNSQNVDRFPQEISKSGYLSADIISGTCKTLK